MPRTPLTDTEREQRRQGDRDRFEHAARDLLYTDGWRRWMHVRATNGLARYSIRNQYLIAHDSAARRPSRCPASTRSRQDRYGR